MESGLWLPVSCYGANDTTIKQSAPNTIKPTRLKDSLAAVPNPSALCHLVVNRPSGPFRMIISKDKAMTITLRLVSSFNHVRGQLFAMTDQTPIQLPLYVE